MNNLYIWLVYFGTCNKCIMHKSNLRGQPFPKTMWSGGESLTKGRIYIKTTEVGNLTKVYAPLCVSFSRQKILFQRRVADGQKVSWNISSYELLGMNNFRNICLPWSFTPYILSHCLYTYPLLYPFTLYVCKCSIFICFLLSLSFYFFIWVVVALFGVSKL